MTPRKFVTVLAVTLVAALGVTAPASAAAPGTGRTPAGVTTHKLQGKGKELGGKVYKGNPGQRGPVSTRATACSSPCYKYAGRTIFFTTSPTGVEADFSIHKPQLRTWDYHSLAEMAVSRTATSGGANTVEAGWTVDRSFTGSDQPMFFVFWWLKGVGQGYNTSDFQVSGSATVTPGQNINSLVGQTKNLEWEYFGPANGCGAGCTEGWWLRWDGSFVGVYPHTLWSSAGETFQTPEYAQNFGEVVLDQEPSQSQMGNGDIATSAVPAQGASINNLGILGTGSPSTYTSDFTTTNADRWNRYNTSATSFKYGGPGGNVTVASTTSPSAQDCSGVGTGNDPSGWGAVCLYDGIVSGVPVTKIAEMEGAAGSICRTGYGSGSLGAGTDMVVNTSYKKLEFYATNNCTGSVLNITGVGRVTLPAPYANAANLSFKVTGNYIACATGYPTTRPTC